MSDVRRAEGRPTLNIDGPDVALVIENRHQWEGYAYALEREVVHLRHNQTGAVDALREIARWLDRSTHTGAAPTVYEWQALTLANAALDRFGGTIAPPHSGDALADTLDEIATTPHHEDAPIIAQRALNRLKDDS